MMQSYLNADIKVSIPQREILIEDGDFDFTVQENSETQNIYSKLLSNKNDLFYDKNFGASLLTHIHNNDFEALQSDVILTLKQDPRIDSSSVDISISQQDSQAILNISFMLITYNTPQNLTIVLDGNLP